MSTRSVRRGFAFGLLAALLFGASTPFAKRLLDDASPQLLAGLLYAGAFITLVAAAPLRRHSPEARLRVADIPRLAGLTAAGGVLAPVLLLVGLERVTGTTASLLLNLEGPLTLLLGLIVFHEHLSRRPALGAGVVFAGAIVLTVDPHLGANDAIGAVCIAGACALWAVDNNLTQSLTTRDPFAIVRVKAGVAATINLLIASLLGDARPTFTVIVGALVLGAMSYGVSVVLDAYALRILGAAREAVVFATAPFAGALLALPVLSETFGVRDVVAAAAMAIGVALMLGERHYHVHAHTPVEHDHLHVHDEHHQHEHPAGTPTDEPHSHPHRHEPLVHAHPHVSDLHHRHSH